MAEAKRQALLAANEAAELLGQGGAHELHAAISLAGRTPAEAAVFTEDDAAAVAAMWGPLNAQLATADDGLRAQMAAMC
eukprot:SAG11_NODE_26574_length_343_cov_1.053279_1_plen_79_part_00